MQKNNTIKTLWIAVVLLLVLNLTTIGTIIYHNSKETDLENIYIEPDMPPLNGMYFRKELNFDENQLDAFRNANHHFRPKANEIVLNIDKEKERLFRELQSNHPDSEIIKEISLQIGMLHAELKESTAQFYLSLFKVCNEDQKNKLKNVFSPLFKDSSGCGGGRGCGNGRQHRHGQGNRNQ